LRNKQVVFIKYGVVNMVKANGYVNRFRRCVMHTLTGTIGNARNSYHLESDSVQRVLISRPNSRLGNQLLITPLVQEILTMFPKAEVDLFVRGSLSPILFKSYPRVGFIMLPGRPFDHLLAYLLVWIRLMSRRYDLTINTVERSSSGRLSVRFSKARCKIYDLSYDELSSLYPDYRHIAKHPVYNIRKVLGMNEKKPVPLLNIKLFSSEREKGRKVMGQFVDMQRKTICIYTFATGEKCLSSMWWSRFYDELKLRYGHQYNILEILPKENISKINFQAPSYYSTDIREMASVMSNACLFIGADCGVMHLAVASGVTTIGLFSVTDINRYGPYGNHNIGIAVDGESTDVVFAAIEKCL
jgi:heptosyltransferase-3